MHADRFAIVAIAGYFINYVVDTWPGAGSAKGAKLLAGAQGAFAVGRFLGSGIMRFFKPRYIFFVYLSCCVAFLAASVTQTYERGVGTYPRYTPSRPRIAWAQTKDKDMTF